MIPIESSTQRRPRNKFGSNRKGALTVNTKVTGVAVLGWLHNILVAVTLTTCVVT